MKHPITHQEVIQMFNVALTDDQVIAIAESLGMDIDVNMIEDFEVGELLDQFIDENA